MPFFDLNIPVPETISNNVSTDHRLLHQFLTPVLQRLIDFEYYGLALTRTVRNKVNPGKDINTWVPDAVRGLPMTATELDTNLHDAAVLLRTRFGSKIPKIRVFSRLNIIADDANAQFKLTVENPVIASYDIISVQPTSEKAFQAVCKDAECDIITFDLSERLPFQLRTTTLNLAIQRGIFLELTYSGCLRDPSIRRNVMSNAVQLLRASRGRNLLISSRMAQPSELRSPSDVINLCTLLGLNQTAARDALCKNTRLVLMHADARKSLTRSTLGLKRKYEDDELS